MSKQARALRRRQAKLIFHPSAKRDRIALLKLSEDCTDQELRDATYDYMRRYPEVSKLLNVGTWLQSVLAERSEARRMRLLQGLNLERR